MKSLKKSTIAVLASVAVTASLATSAFVGLGEDDQVQDNQVTVASLINEEVNNQDSNMAKDAAAEAAASQAEQISHTSSTTPTNPARHSLKLLN